MWKSLIVDLPSDQAVELLEDLAARLGGWTHTVGETGALTSPITVYTLGRPGLIDEPDGKRRIVMDAVAQVHPRGAAGGSDTKHVFGAIEISVKSSGEAESSVECGAHDGLEIPLETLLGLLGESRPEVRRQLHGGPARLKAEGQAVAMITGSLVVPAGIDDFQAWLVRETSVPVDPDTRAFRHFTGGFVKHGGRVAILTNSIVRETDTGNPVLLLPVVYMESEVPPGGVEAHHVLNPSPIGRWRSGKYLLHDPNNIMVGVSFELVRLGPDRTEVHYSAFEAWRGFVDHIHGRIAEVWPEQEPKAATTPRRAVPADRFLFEAGKDPIRAATPAQAAWFQALADSIPSGASLPDIRDVIAMLPAYATPAAAAPLTQAEVLTAPEAASGKRRGGRLGLTLEKKRDIVARWRRAEARGTTQKDFAELEAIGVRTLYGYIRDVERADNPQPP